MSGKTVLYQSVGEQLTHYDVDVEAATLTRRASIAMPSNVQYVWPYVTHVAHDAKKYLSVTTSDAASGNTPNPGQVHRLCAVRVGADGALALHGEPQPLPSRPIHHCVDRAGAYVVRL